MSTHLIDSVYIRCRITPAARHDLNLRARKAENNAYRRHLMCDAIIGAKNFQILTLKHMKNTNF